MIAVMSFSLCGPAAGLETNAAGEAEKDSIIMEESLLYEEPELFIDNGIDMEEPDDSEGLYSALDNSGIPDLNVLSANEAIADGLANADSSDASLSDEFIMGELTDGSEPLLSGEPPENDAWSTAAVGDNEACWQSVAETAACLLNNMEVRETSSLQHVLFPGSLARTGENMKAYANFILVTALRHNGDPRGGDYLDHNIVSTDNHITVDSVKNDDGDCQLTIRYEFTYLTNFFEERQLNEKVESILSELDFADYSDLEIIRTIYQYVRDHVSYDYEHQNSPNYRPQYTAYAAVFSQKANYLGYSTLLYRLLLELGVNCRIITGTRYGVPHAWNIVQIGDYFYNVDVASDSRAGGTLDYFLLSNSSFDGYVRNDWLNTEDYNQANPMASWDYNIYCQHTYTYETIKATTTSNGARIGVCTKCGNEKLDQIILAAANALELSQERFVYDGTPKKPAVTLKDLAGQIISPDYYTVIYPSACQDARSSAYKVRVRLKDLYEGELSADYYIDKAPSMINVTTPKKLLPSIGEAPQKVEAYVSKGDTAGQVFYKTNNEAVLYVTPDGLVTPVGVGGATVVAYYPGSKNYKYGNAKVSVFVRPEKVNFTTISNKRGVLSLAWNLCEGCTYQIQIGKDPAFRDHTTLTAAQGRTGYSKGGLEIGLTYYLRIRTHVVSNGKDYFSYWSPVTAYTLVK